MPPINVMAEDTHHYWCHMYISYVGTSMLWKSCESCSIVFTCTYHFMDTSGHDMAGSAQENPPVAHVALVYDVMVAHLIL